MPAEIFLISLLVLAPLLAAFAGWVLFRQHFANLRRIERWANEQGVTLVSFHPLPVAKSPWAERMVEGQLVYRVIVRLPDNENARGWLLLTDQSDHIEVCYASEQMGRRGFPVVLPERKSRENVGQ